MRKNINTEHIEGYLYECKLYERVSGETAKNPGQSYLNGDIVIAIDEEGLNTISVHYTYVAPTWPSGKKNRNYDVLKRFIDEKDTHTWIAAGKDNAFKVKVSGMSLEINDFVPADSQDGEIVSSQRNGGGFIDIVDSIAADEKARSSFEIDAIIHKTRRVEANEDRGIENDYLVLECMCFNFRNEIFPASFNVYNENGIKFFEDLDISGKDPLYTKLWGRMTTTTHTRKIVEETAFSGPIVREVRGGTTREWIVTNTAKVPYDFGDEEVMTAEDLQKLLQDREIVKAEVKKRAQERKEQSAKTVITEAAPSFGAANATIPTGSFKF